MAKKAKRSTKRSKPSAGLGAAKSKNRARGEPRASKAKRGSRAFGDGDRASRSTARLPAAITGVPKTDVGDTVQSFLDNDSVLDVDVRAETGGLFTVSPVR